MLHVSCPGNVTWFNLYGEVFGIDMPYSSSSFTEATNRKGGWYHTVSLLQFSPKINSLRWFRKQPVPQTRGCKWMQCIHNKSGRTYQEFKKISQTNMLISPLKKNPDIVPHLCVASVEPPWLETTHSLKCTYMQDVLCSVIKRIMQLKCRFCGPDKHAFTLLYT